MSNEINRHRRQFLGTAATTIAAASLGVIPSADAQTRKIQPTKRRSNTSFGPVKQIDAGLLNVGYAEAGPGNGYDKYRHDFNKLIWKNVSPKWDFDDATFDRTAASFNNPDHVAIVIHNYRWRLSLATGEPRYDDLEQKLFMGPVIIVPTITIASDFDGPAGDGSSYRKKFSGKYSHRIFKGIGHNVPQEAPQAFAKAIVDVDGY